MLRLYLIIYIAFCLIVGSCGKKGTPHLFSYERTDFVGDTIQMKYAEHITMVRYTDHVEVALKDPWHEGKELARYCLWMQDKGEGMKDERGICLPLKRSVVFNTAHASLLQMLGALDAIKGVADLKYMNLPAVKGRVRSGACLDCGDSMNPDIETMVELGADAIWLSPFENSGGYGALEKLGVPLIVCADYMETSALGRAEWMKFYGLLVGKEHEADSLFAVVERNYNQLKKQAQQGTARRSVLTERLTGSTWYVPGGRSSMGRLLQDAGARYAWEEDAHSGSLALSFETVLDQAGDADVWVFNDMGAEPPSYQRLLAEYGGYAQLKAFRNRQVYYVNSLQVPYFEEVSFRPDWLLQDYVTIVSGGEQNPPLRYLRKVSDDE